MGSFSRAVGLESTFQVHSIPRRQYRYVMFEQCNAIVAVPMRKCPTIPLGGAAAAVPTPPTPHPAFRLVRGISAENGTENGGEKKEWLNLRPGNSIGNQLPSPAGMEKKKERQKQK